jgi:SAM-dependent methyltransferase
MLESESSLMRFCRGIGMDSIAWALRRLHCPVAPDALVLEVGSGGNPYARANVLLDAYEETRERHWAPLIADRPLVLGFVEDLPFRDHAFDFVIASHVLEHSARPERFLAELQRVARAGYIETPDAFMERVNPYRDHRLEVTTRDGRLVIRKKTAWRADEPVVELYEHAAKPLIAGQLIPRHPFEFHVRHYWETRIEFTIVNPRDAADWQAPGTATDAAHGAAGSAGVKGAILNALRNLLSQHKRNRALDLIPLLRCPTCHANAIANMGDNYKCSACKVDYPVKMGVPVMHHTGPATVA